MSSPKVKGVLALATRLADKNDALGADTFEESNQTCFLVCLVFFAFDW